MYFDWLVSCCSGWLPRKGRKQREKDDDVSSLDLIIDKIRKKADNFFFPSIFCLIRICMLRK